jgi:hypothetical protein
MSAIAFFPWLRLRKDFSVGGTHFLRYERGRLPFGNDAQQKQADAVLGRYVVPVDGPVEHAVIVVPDIAQPTRDLSDAEIQGLFELRELITVSALSERSFFVGGSFQYCNSHSFSMIVQRFQDVDSGVNVVSRRRDGAAHAFWSRGTYQVTRPDHVPSAFTGLELDGPLLEALQRSRSGAAFDRISDAVAGFNLANTDSADILPRVELALLNGAFERLFDCRSGKEDDLASRFVATVQPRTALFASDYPRTAMAAARANRQISVREVWIRDFFRSRGDLAHGRTTPGRTPIWQLNEHLLLGTYTFPLVLKAVLEQEKLYTLSLDDEDFIEILEKVYITELFNISDPHVPAPEWPWNKVMEEVQTRRLGRALEDAWKETESK